MSYSYRAFHVISDSPNKILKTEKPNLFQDDLCQYSFPFLKKIPL